MHRKLWKNVLMKVGIMEEESDRNAKVPNKDPVYFRTRNLKMPWLLNQVLSKRKQINII